MTLDLWTPKFDEDRLHPNFRTILSHGSQEAREVISSWSNDFPDRDGKLIDEFQLTFDSSFWELYLNAAFQQLGFSCQYNHPSPDFELIDGANTVIAEAAIASNAGGYRPEWDKQGFVRTEGFDIRQAIRYTATRLSNAITTKAKKYIDSYQALTHVNEKPFVICVAPFDFPFSFDWSQTALRQVLYGIDEPMIERNSEGEKFVIGLSESQAVTKDSGVDIPVGLFRDDQLSHVSAVLFSSLATFSKARALSEGAEEYSLFRAERYNAHGTESFVQVAKKPEYTESLLDGLILCLNPHANHLLDPSRFQDTEISIESWNPDTNEYICEAPHNSLIRRFVFTTKVRESNKDAETSSIPTEPEYNEIARPKWTDRELRPVNGILGLAINNHLAHVDDWTAVVFQDSVDGTWHAMAVKLHVHSLLEFREVNGDEGPGSVARLDDHATLEEAFNDICDSITEFEGAKSADT